MSKSKCTKDLSVGQLLEVDMSRKCTPLWREARFQVNMLKTPHARTTFAGSTFVSRRRRKGLCILPKVKCAKCGGVGHLKRIRNMFTRDVRRSGRRFPERGCILELRSSSLLRWFSVTGEALRMTWRRFFVAGAVLLTGGVEKSQNAFVRGRQPCTQVSIFEGCLAELLRFWCWQLRKLRKSRRIAWCLTLSKSKIEEVSQNCCASDVVKFKNWGSLAEYLRFQACR